MEIGLVCPCDQENGTSKHNSVGKNWRGKEGRMLRDSVTQRHLHLDGEMMGRYKEYREYEYRFLSVPKDDTLQSLLVFERGR